MMFYKTLGFAVWKGAKWYAGRKLSRKIVVGGAMAAGAATLAAFGAARGATA
jgi:hypothetical protein